MTYATQQNLVDRYGEAELIQLTDRAAEPIGAIDAGVVAAALADADKLIDGYIGARYQLPLVSTPDLLVPLASSIARYRLFKDSPNEVVRKNYEDALRQLRDLSNGLMVLDVAGIVPPSAGTNEILTSAPDRVFTSDSMKCF